MWSFREGVGILEFTIGFSKYCISSADHCIGQAWQASLIFLLFSVSGSFIISIVFCFEDVDLLHFVE